MNSYNVITREGKERALLLHIYNHVTYFPQAFGAVE